MRRTAARRDKAGEVVPMDRTPKISASFCPQNASAKGQGRPVKRKRNRANELATQVRLAREFRRMTPGTQRRFLRLMECQSEHLSIWQTGCELVVTLIKAILSIFQ